MVNKAYGPVKFRPLDLPDDENNINKPYQSEQERKSLVLRKILAERLKLSMDEEMKESVVEFGAHKKWLTIRVPSRGLYVMTYPEKGYGRFS